jgi:peptidoglycan/xylan/chitin deacetylase (PgdA/CDA1 family)
MAATLARMLGRRVPTVVLMYHRVGPEERSLHGLRVRDDRFDAQLGVVRRHADIVPLADVLTPSRRPRVVITFDDGYADNLRIGQPTLARYDAPATMFVTAGVIESGRGFWQDRLANLMLDGHDDTAAGNGAPRVDVEIAGDRVGGDLHDAAAREELYRALHARLRRRPPGEIETVVAKVAAQLDRDPAGLRTPPILSIDDVRTLAASDGITIGAHTLRHPWLTALDEAAQRSEIEGSRDLLEEWTGTAVKSFAYPFGEPEAFDATSVRVAGQCGFDVSVTALGEPMARSVNAQRVPRRFVGDWDADRFEARLQGWLAA